MPGYFKGGDMLIAHLRSIEKTAGNASNVKVGFDPEATYPDGTKVATVALINEYGAPSMGIPPRPVIRNTLKKHGKGWGRIFGLYLKSSNYDAFAALDKMGTRMEDQLKQSIEDMLDPPNAPSTIAKKHSDHPLIDTRLMINSVKHIVG